MMIERDEMAKDEISIDGRLVFINADRNSGRGSFASGKTFYINWELCDLILFNEESSVKITSEVFQGNLNWDLVPKCSEEKEISSIRSEKEIEHHQKGSAPNAEMGLIEYLDEYPKGVNVLVGKSVNVIGFKDYYFNPSSTDVNQLNIGVLGDLGTGKTQLLKGLIYQLAKSDKANRGVAPKFLILDTKRDYDGSGNSLDIELLEAIGGKVVTPHKIPLNLFDIRDSDELNPALNRANFFIDVLNRIYGGIGPVQKDNLRNAIMNSYHENGYNTSSSFDRRNFVAPTLEKVRDVYKGIVKQVDAPLSIMNNLVMEELFETESEKTRSFRSFFDGSIVVALGRIANSMDSLKLIMVIFLKLYQEYMLSVRKEGYVGTSPSLRKIDSFILIDEAKLIMDYDFQILEDLLRKGREFGIGVILSSQYLTDFDSSKFDYKQPLSTWFIHKVPDISSKELKSIGIVNADEEIVSSIKSLEKHFCLYKTANQEARIIRGLPFYEIFKEES
jgi:hypothetical protein